jgi:DNA-binding response OmpR family regulator
MSGRVLIISDDAETARSWGFALQQSGFETNRLSPSDVDDTSQRPEPMHDLILIDVYAPDIDRLLLIRRLREDATIPILLLLPNHDEMTMLEAYEADVDEVIIRPISFRLLRAKVAAWMRRSLMVPTSLLDNIQVGDLRLDTPHRQVVTESGEVIRLTGLEFRLVHLLMSHADRVLESALIVDRIWGASGGDNTLLKNLVYRARRKIEPDPTEPRYIVSVAGEGYMFVSSQAK